jgi:iron complex outermembrane recepter protein
MNVIPFGSCKLGACWIWQALALIGCALLASSVAAQDTASSAEAAAQQPVGQVSDAGADGAVEQLPEDEPVPRFEPEQVTLAPATEQEREPSDDEAMVVTGSRIKRSASLAASAPVEVLDSKAIARTGASNVSDLIQLLTAAQGSGFQGGGNPGNAGGGAYGAASINLRGLGAASTLVLVNGRRLVPSGGGGGAESFADVGVIPLAAIERVEILKGGGSAIYGADAVGGVVNIITRAAWNGLRLQLDGQGATRADHGEFTVSGAYGAKTERARLMLALSYSRRSELRSDKRPFSQAANVDVNGNPGTFILPGFDPANPTRTRFPDPGCTNAEGSMLQPIPGTQDVNCIFNFSRFFTLISGLERAHIFGSGSFDLSKHVTLFAEAQVQRARTNIYATPAYSVPPPLLVVPADHVDNPFGRPATFVGRPFGAAAGAQSTVIGDDTFRVVAGARGDIPSDVIEDWDWEISGSWGVSRYTSFVSDTLREPLTRALNSCSDPKDLSGCYNPFFSAIDGTGTPNSQKVVDSIYGTATTVSEHFLQTYHAGMSGSLFNLPGGPLGAAVGAELRHERRQTQTDHDSTEQRFTFFLGSTDANASRDVLSGYAELRWPFWTGIELQTAVRVERYTDIGRTTPSPFAGLSVTPAKIFGPDKVPAALRRLSLTGQVTSAFRAPTLYQANPGFQVVPTPLRIPGNPLPIYSPVQNFGNPSLQPERALVFTGGVNYQPIDALQLFAELWQYDYRNRIALDSAQQVLDRDLMLLQDSQPGDPRVVRDPATGDLVRVQLTQQNIAGKVSTSGVDFGATLTFTDPAFGMISVGAQGTLTLSYTIPRAQAAGRRVPNVQPAQTLEPLNCTAERCEAVGSRNYNTIAPPLPRLRLHAPIVWAFDNHLATVMLHYTSGIANDNDVQSDGQLGWLGAQLTCDLQYGYTIPDWIGKELSLRVGIYNVFDTLPPATRDNNGFETMLYDPRGRMAYLKLVASY